MCHCLTALHNSFKKQGHTGLIAIEPQKCTDNRDDQLRLDSSRTFSQYFSGIIVLIRVHSDH